MILLLDIGNTRLKWAQLDGGMLGAQFASVHTQAERMALMNRLLETNPKPDRVLISNVGGTEIGAFCAGAILQRWGIEAEFVQSTRTAAGVTNAYAEPAKLGVDRWLAVIAAHAMQRGAACIVSVGTAMTIDGVDADGRHLGGVIVPGPHLMVSSLLKNTSDIASRMAGEESQGTALFAKHTAGAVTQGSAHALAALIDRAAAEMKTIVGIAPLLILTGGASESIAPFIRTLLQPVPDLVLRGLAVLARQPG
jgi:type III pantothenate kinase